MKVKIVYGDNDFEIDFPERIGNKIILTYYGGNPGWLYEVIDHAVATT